MESDSKKPRIDPSSNSSPALPYLDEDVIIQILTRVPVKHLFRFKLVCKNWRDTISSSTFKNQHLQASIQRESCYKLITVSGDPNRNFKSCSIESIYYNHLNVESENLGHPLVDEFFRDWIVGSCNGLVCLRFQMDMIYLWNPCTKESRRLPSMSLTNGLFQRAAAYVVYGFGYDKRSDDYKVLAIVCAPKMLSYETDVLIYSRKADAWRKSDPFPASGPYELPGRLLNGALHWAVPCSSIGAGFLKLLCIAAFDLETEKFRQISLPDENINTKLSNARLGVLRDSLCLICIEVDYIISLLVMKEYGVKESWITLFKMSINPWSNVVTPLWSLEKGEVLLLLDQHMVLVHPTKGTLRHPKIRNSIVFAGANVYLESFVSP